MSERVVRVFLEILRVCREEGEDVNLKDVLKALPSDLRDFCEEQLSGYLGLPPRIALAKIARSKEFSRIFEKVAEVFVEELLEEINNTLNDSK